MLKDPLKVDRQRPQGRRSLVARRNKDESPIIRELLKIETSFKRNQRHTADPIELVKKYSDPKDQEIAGFIVALLAYGNVNQIKKSALIALSFLGEHPHSLLIKTDDKFWFKFFSKNEFKHRFTTKWDLAWIFFWIGNALRKNGSLEKFFLTPSLQRVLTRIDSNGENLWLLQSLADFIDRFTQPKTNLLPANTRSMKFLLSDPRKKSACKRLLLYLRWMVSPFYPDLHIWKTFPVKQLLVPVDTHVLRISKNLGFTKSNQANWNASVEITAALRRLSPENPPIRFDFPLCHFGISKACPSKRSEKICGICGMNSVCLTYSKKR